MAQSKVVEVTKFLGLNEAYGDTEISPGEAIYMRNLRITSDNNGIQKRNGYEKVLEYANTGVEYVDGMWIGRIASKDVIISIFDDKVYEYNFATTVNSVIYSGYTSTTGKGSSVTIFFANNKLYFIGLDQYNQYDGTTFQSTVGYIPTVSINAPPTGGGTVFEEINLLTGFKKQTFVGDGVTATYQIAETNISADLLVITVNGVTKTETTHFTVDRTTGIVTFLAGNIPPLATTGNVVIQWNKSNTTNKEFVTKNKYAVLFGVGNDTRVFMWGNASYKNRRINSYQLDPTYFPTTYYVDIGSNEFEITDILVANANTQIIFKKNSAYYSFSEYNTATSRYAYPVLDLNESIGCDVSGASQIIDSQPISIQTNSIYKWSATSVKDERNTSIISERIRKSLAQEDFTYCKTFDYQKEKELWINIGSLVYVHNYANNTWYTYDNIDAKCFYEYNGVLYFGGMGKVYRFTNEYNDNEAAINAIMYTGFNDYGLYQFKKTTRDLWLMIQPESKTSINVKVATNKKNANDPSLKTFTKSYNLFDFGNIDFDNFSFNTNRNPQVFHFKVRAKNYTSIQYIFSNSVLNEPMLLLSYKASIDINNQV